nr:MAG TPA: hypothetical protein [Bacteriophage sp.]
MFFNSFSYSFYEWVFATPFFKFFKKFSTYLTAVGLFLYPLFTSVILGYPQ